MSAIKSENIAEAATRIKDLVPQTPFIRSYFLARELQQSVYLKLESMNRTGSFKIRGAANALLSQDKSKLKNGVVAASAGNHAQGVALVCRELGVEATIFMPTTTPRVKIQSTERYGAQIRLTGHIYDEAYDAAVKYAKSQGAFFLHAYADPDVIMGQGTVAAEICTQLNSDIDEVYVPIGGGGLISGVAIYLKEKFPNIKIIGVQTESFPSMKLSYDAGKITPSETKPTIAEGIAVKKVNQLNLDLIKSYVDEVVLVSEKQIAAALVDLCERDHLLVEGCSASAVAAMRLKHANRSKTPHAERKNIVGIMTGGNIDISLVAKIIEKDLILKEKVVKVKLHIPDKPGSLTRALDIFAAHHANILEIEHQRGFEIDQFTMVNVHVVFESFGHEHKEVIFEALRKVGYLE